MADSHAMKLYTQPPFRHIPQRHATEQSAFVHVDIMSIIIIINGLILPLYYVNIVQNNTY